MSDTPPDDASLLAAIEEEFANLDLARSQAQARFAELGEALKMVDHHPNYTAYVHGGLLADKGFGADHVLALAGFAALPWREAIDRIETIGDAPQCLLTRIRVICEQDASLEQVGLAWSEGAGLLRKGKVPALWTKRPKLGLGQPAKAFGLTPQDAAAHRCPDALEGAVMAQAFATIAGGRDDASFGALIPAVIAQGGHHLHDLGAAALHADAEARYREDGRRFVAHQAATSDRRWRDKPPRSRQGHLAVSTARKKGIDLPSERKRGDAATWLEGHDANLRFNGDKT